MRRKKKRVPRIEWEKLQVETVAEAFRDHMEVKMEAYEVERTQAAGEIGEMSGWAKFAEVVVGGAKEVCGVKKKSVENPWMVGREVEIGMMRRQVCVAQERRNMALLVGRA